MPDEAQSGRPVAVRPVTSNPNPNANPQQPSRPRQHPNVVNADTWTDGRWPLTISGGLLSCVGEAVFITDGDGRMWPLNGNAREAAGSFGAEPAIDPIWRPNPDIPGARVNIGPLIQHALTLC